VFMGKKNNRNDVPIKVLNRNFIIVMLINFGLCLGHHSVYPLVDSYTKLLNASATLAGFLVGMFYMVALGMRPISGPIITRMDKRKLIIYIFAIGIVTNVAYAVFPTLGAFAAFRILNGIQYGFVGPLVMTLAADHTPQEQMATGLGLYGVGGAIGQSVAALIATALLDWGTAYRQGAGYAEFDAKMFGFKLVFIFAALMFALTALAAVLLPPDSMERSENTQTVKWYKNIATPHTIGLSVVIMLLIMSNVLYNAYIKKFADEQMIPNIAVFLTVYSIVLLVSRPVSGILNNKLGFKRIIVPGIVIFISSFFIVATSKTLWQVCIGGGIAALGYGACQPAIQAMAVLTVSPSQRGLASNTLYIGMDLGFFLGPLIGGVLLEYQSYANMYFFGSIPAFIALVGIFVVFPAFDRRRRELDDSR